jgi:hypothetical protein
MAAMRERSETHAYLQSTEVPSKGKPIPVHYRFLGLLPKIPFVVRLHKIQSLAWQTRDGSPAPQLIRLLDAIHIY